MNQLADLVGVDFPLFGFSHCRDVVVAVSRAGGFGVLGGSGYTPESLEVELQWIDDHVGGKPYGIDILIPENQAVSRTATVRDLSDAIPQEHRGFVLELLQEHGITMDGGRVVSERMPSTAPVIGEQLMDVAFRHPIRLIANALGIAPPSMIERGKQHGVPVAALVGAKEHALRQIHAGVDILVAQGGEAGGHCGEVSTLVLVPEVIRAVEAMRPVPVLAAGGIMTGAQMAACMAIGAAGAWTGSVWLATPESEVTDTFREKMIAATSRDTVRSAARTGKPSRQLRSAWHDAWESGDSPGALKMPMMSMLSEPALGQIDKAADAGNLQARELVTYWVGQGVGLVDRVRTSAQVVQDFMADFEVAAQRLSHFTEQETFPMSIFPLREQPVTAASFGSLLQTQRSAHLAAGPPSLAERRDRLDRLVLMLTDNAEQFALALNADFGNRPRVVNQLSEIGGILPDIAATRSRLGRWMRPRRVMPALSAFGVSVVVEPRPLGVVGVVGPWNFPIALVAQPTASAFAAGNRVMVKMSEVTWRTADAFASAAAQYFEPEELAVVTGGADVAAEFCSLPLDHLFFTGSPAVGRLVARAAAANLVPVTLELGGKNPAVVATGYSLRKAAERILAARLGNGGQICLCPDYVFVPARDKAEFVREVMSAAARLLPTVAENPDIVSIVNPANFERVVELIEDARRQGALVHQAIPAGEQLPDAERRRIPPTVIEGVTDGMDIASNEVFGPVLTVFGYENIAEVVDYVNARPTPLAAYWFGAKNVEFKAFSRRVTSGGMTINDFALHCAISAAPFGGVGGSGYGAYHGRAGFDTFSHARTVATSRLPMSLASLSLPPFSQRFTNGVDSYLARARRKAARRARR